MTHPKVPGYLSIYLSLFDS